MFLSKSLSCNNLRKFLTTRDSYRLSVRVDELIREIKSTNEFYTKK